MKPLPLSLSCVRCPLNRRRFLGASLLASAGAACGPWASGLLRAASADPLRVRVVYSLHGEQQEGPDWPNKGFDFRPAMDRFNAAFAKGCRDIEFSASLATGAEQAKAILEADAGRMDGYVVFQMNCWNQVVQTIVASGKPVLYADFQYGGSGGFLVYTAGFLRKATPNVGFVASSKIEDVVDAVKCFRVLKEGGSAAQFAQAVTVHRTKSTPKPNLPGSPAGSVDTLPPEDCLARMKASRILAVRGPETAPSQTMMGIPVDFVPFAEVNDAWKAADPDAAREVADRWQRGAALVSEVSQETLQASAAMYLGMKAVMQKRQANAITVNCLGGFYGGHLHAYPCLGFHELLNEGLVGACECDLRSTSTMVAMTQLTRGRPGYISDPVVDTAKRQIIYAHCVASNKPFGPAGPANPFEILTHSEDRQGASVRSLLPLRHLTTSVEFAHERKEILFHQGWAVANDPDDRACRTKLAVEPLGDLEKLFTQWDQWGWHRVTYYGDLKQPVFALADALGYKVIQEA